MPARARCGRVALMASDVKTTLLERIGLVDDSITRIGANDPAQQAGRVPTGIELAKRFRDVVVTEAELISDAEAVGCMGMPQPLRAPPRGPNENDLKK